MAIEFILLVKKNLMMIGVYSTIKKNLMMIDDVFSASETTVLSEGRASLH